MAPVKALRLLGLSTVRIRTAPSSAVRMVGLTNSPRSADAAHLSALGGCAILAAR
jgi:hypothetical protein